MKKVILVLLVVLVGIGIVWYLRLPGPVEPMDRLVPRDAFLYFSIRRGAVLWEKIEGSGWWKRVAGAEAPARMRETLAASARRQALELGLDLEKGDLLELFGVEVGVALVPGVRSGGTLLVLARVSGSLSGEIMRNLENSGIYRVDASRYRPGGLAMGTKMLLLRSPEGKGPAIGVCRIGGVLAYAISDEDPLAVLRQIVDLARGRGEDSLGESDPYRKVMSVSGEAPECCAVMYFNFSRVGEDDKLLPGGLDIPGDFAGQLGRARRGLILSLKRMKAGGGMVRLKDGLLATLYYIPSIGGMDEASRELLRLKPKKFKALKLVPSDQMVYSASLFGDAADLWDSFTGALEQSNLTNASAIAGAVRDWEAETGISLEKDVFPLVGDEFAYFLSAPREEQLLPLPGLGLIIRVEDAEKARSVMESAVASLLPPESTEAPEGEAGTEGEKRPSPETETYKGHTITFIPAGLVGLQPVCAVLGDFVVAASDAAVMRTMVDVWLGEGESVKASALYKNLGEEFGNAANSLTFVNMERSLEYLKSLSRIIGSLMSLAGDEGSVPPDFMPFLECMEVVRYIYARTEMSEEVVKQVIFVKAGDLES